MKAVNGPDTMKDTVCIVPWNSVYIDGNVNLCCNSVKGPRLTDSGKIPTLDDLDTILSDKQWTEIRQSMLAGEKHPTCDRCWKMEPNSFRANHNNQFSDTLKKIIENNSSDVMALESMTIAIGNLCNLNCRMCFPNASSMLEKEWSREDKHPLGRGVPKRPDMIVSDLGIKESFLKDPRFLDFIRKNGEHLKDIYMFGGEPFIIIEEHLTFLQALIDVGSSKNITLRYSTNGTNTTLRRFTDLWSHFKEINIQVSCDGMEEVYDYIRWPSKWSKMKENLNYFADLKRNHNIFTSVACTMQNLTLLQADRFEKFIKEEYDLGIYYIPVDNPTEFSLKTVPIEVLQKVYDNTPTERIKNIIQSHIDNYNESESISAYNDMLKVVKWQDNYRNQHLHDFFPTIDEWFKDNPARANYND
jgi:sulfatase maturation enzyme AslB (radical SAM superfamily)